MLSIHKIYFIYFVSQKVNWPNVGFNPWKISICLETQHSKSRSLSASILVEDSNEIVLNYEYLNEPKPKARPSMNIHRGTTRLILSSDFRELDGDYYSGRGRQNYGSLKFKKS